MKNKIINKIKNNWQYSLSILFVAIVIVIGVIYIFNKPEKVKAEWYDDGWAYRQTIAISNSGSAQTDVQVKILSGVDLSALIAAGKLQSDLDDLRFTDINGNVLRYWIEDSTTTSIDLWGVIDYVPSSGTTVYMYYGNPIASAYSNAASVKQGGGTLSTVSGYRIHTFTGDGTFSTGENITAEVLVVAGGGGGGARHAGGGGGGGVLHSASSSIVSGTHIVTVGDGGAGTINVYPDFVAAGSNGGNSVFGSLIAIGGGGGGSWNSGQLGTVGGSGGGNITTAQIAGTAGQGYAGGGSNTNASPYNHGGGGGASAAGQNGQATKPGDGGNGVAYDISGVSTYYGGGGGGGSHTPHGTTSSGGLGGGGNEGTNNGTANTGGGGAGGTMSGGGESGGNGGSGIVIIKYAAITTISAVSPASEEKGPGPVGYWKFDEGYGSTTYDQTTNSNNGTISGATWQTEDMCISGKCLYFNGTSDYVNNGTSTLFDFVGDMTIEMWIKPITLPTSTNIGFIAKRPLVGGVARWHFGINNDLSGYNFYNGVAEYQSSERPAINEWTHLAMVLDSGTSVKYYENGVLVDTVAGASMGSATGDPVTIGKSGADTLFNGFMDDAKLYNYARTAAQVQADYLAGQSGLASGAAAAIGGSQQTSLSDGLIGYWKMDEGSGNVLDSSGNGNTGTSTGTTVVAGKYGDGRSFNGTVSDYISTPFSTSSSNGTISMWFKYNGTNAYIIVGGDGDSSWNANHIYFYLSSSNILGAVSYGNNGGVFGLSSGTLSAGNWYHAVVTSESKLYINGELVDSDVAGWTDSFIDFDHLNFARLKYNSALYDAQLFNGSLDEVRIYNRALSAKEVRDLYNWAPGPVAYYNFDEGSGTSLYDRSGNGYSSTAFGGAPSWVSGKYGKGLEFNGTSDYVTRTTANFQSSDYAGTISAWVKLTDVADFRYIVHSADEATGNYQLSMSIQGTTGKPYIYQRNNDTADYVVGSTNVADGNWHYVVAVSDGSSYSLFVDGVAETLTAASGSNTGDWLADTPNRDNLVIGVNKRSSLGAYFKGDIDEVKIYNYARTTKQIVEDMNAGHPVGGSPVASQLGYWKFDEGYGSTVYDSGFGGNNGTITDASWINNGKIDRALSFDGGTTVVSVPTFSYESDEQYTLSAWIKASGGQQTWLVKETSWSDGFKQWGGYNSWFFRAGDGTNAADLWSSYTGLGVSAGQWFHWVMVRNHDTWTMYINGKENSSRTNSLIGSTNNSGSLKIGNRLQVDWNPEFQGQMDEVKIYNYALTADEVLLDMNQGASNVLGNLGTDSSGNPDNSASRAYCVPGDSSTCNAPVAEWKFDEKTGSTAHDTSGNSNNGTISGATWTRGKIGSAIDSNGSGFATITDSAVLRPSSISIEAWVKLNSLTTYGAIVSNRAIQSGVQTYNDAFGVNASGNLIFTSGKTTWSWNTVTASSVLSAGRWYHVTAVKDGGTLTKFYVDGVQESTSGGVAEAINYNSGTSMNIGRYYISGYEGPYYIDGIVDDVKIYNYARTPAQVAWDFNRGAPVGWWKFDECEGATAYDWAPSGDGYRGHDATINIAATGTQTAVGTCTTSGTAWYNGSSGHNNSAMNFDGTDDYVQVMADGSSTYNFQEYSIAAWFKSNTDPDTATQSIWSYDYTAHSGYYYAQHIRLGGASAYNDEISFYWNNGSTYHGIDGDGALTGSQTDWHHVVATFKSGSQKLYFDGKEIGSNNQTDTITYSAQEVWIGKANFGGFFDGKIDDVRIYNYALTQEQVNSVMNDGAVSF